MFAERVAWAVSRDVGKRALEIVREVAHDMDGSGGLIRAFSGAHRQKPDRLLFLTFWKGWEDLSRYLAGRRSAAFDELIRLHSVERPKPEHFEVVWGSNGEVIDTVRGDWLWSFDDFLTRPPEGERLLECLGGLAPDLRHHSSFAGAGLWLDRINPGHLVLSGLWQPDAPESACTGWAAPLAGRLPPDTQHKQSLYKLLVADPVRLAVP